MKWTWVVSQQATQSPNIGSVPVSTVAADDRSTLAKDLMI
jgi:hypothetical protein